MVTSAQKVPINPEELSVGDRVFTYRTDREFEVTGFSKYALNCQAQMISFKNVRPTDDTKAGEIWTLEVDIFIKQFYTLG